MGKWRCDHCGMVHETHPLQCKKCGHSVLTRHREGGTRALKWILLSLLGFFLVLLALTGQWQALLPALLG